MTRPKLELDPAALVVATQTGILLHSDLGTFQLTGNDVRTFVEVLAPLLDGSRDEEAVAAQATGYSPESVRAFLQVMIDRGLVQEARAGESCQQRTTREFFARWPARGDEDPSKRLTGAHILVVGLEPWGVLAALQLAGMGVAALDLVDAGYVTKVDVEVAGLFKAEHLGCPRAESLASLIRSAYPSCAVNAEVFDPVNLAGSTGRCADFMVVALERDNLRSLDSVSRFAHANSLTHLIAFMDGLEAVVGPSVVPGKTPCWNCCRLRRLANDDNPRVMHQLHSTLLAEAQPPRPRSYLAPMHGVLGNLIALEATKLITRYTPSELLGRQLVQNLVSLQTTVHGLVRLPWCEVCGGSASACSGISRRDRTEAEPSSAPTVLSSALSPEQLRAAMGDWVDERTGVIRHLVLNQADPRDPELPRTATAVTAAYTDGVYYEHDTEIGSGKGVSASEAMLGAMGEAIERYSAARYRRADFHRSSFDRLTDDAIDPRSLGLYSSEQYALPGFPYARFDPLAPIDWVRGHWLDSGQAVWVPALVTYFNLHVEHAERFCQVSSNGLAAGANEADAALRASLELIERDAFMLTWLAQNPARRIHVEGALDPDIHEVLRQLRAKTSRVELFDVGVELGVPVVACVAFGDGKVWPGATVALAAHLDLRVAVRKAVLEQGHVGPYIRRLMTADPPPPIPGAPEEVRSLTEHALYYVPSERSAAFDFLGVDNDAIELGVAPVSAAASLDMLRERIASKVRIAVVDVTSPDVSGSPFRVARAVGVDMQQIEFGHRLRRLPGSRLMKLLNDRAINPNPHPVA